MAENSHSALTTFRASDLSWDGTSFRKACRIPISFAGWDVAALTDRVRQAQQGGGESLDLVDLQDLGITSTAIEERSWGQLKAEARGGGL